MAEPEAGRAALVSLQIAVRKVGNVTIVDLRGRATIGAGNDALNSQLRKLVDGGVRHLLVNLGGVSQVDSSGISSLVRAYVTLERVGGKLRLLRPQSRVREILELTRLLGAIPTFEDEAKALGSFL